VGTVGISPDPKMEEEEEEEEEEQRTSGISAAATGLGSGRWCRPRSRLESGDGGGRLRGAMAPAGTCRPPPMTSSFFPGHTGANCLLPMREGCVRPLQASLHCATGTSTHGGFSDAGRDTVGDSLRPVAAGVVNINFYSISRFKRRFIPYHQFIDLTSYFIMTNKKFYYM
jgi:hypothetical protein